MSRDCCGLQQAVLEEEAGWTADRCGRLREETNLLPLLGIELELIGVQSEVLPSVL